MRYKGFTTTNIVEENGIYSTTVENSKEYLKITADSLQDIQSAFENTIDKYIEKYTKLGIEP